MANLSVQEILNEAVALGGVAVTEDGEFTNNAGTLVYMENDSVGTIVVTFAVQKSEVTIPGYGNLTVSALVATVVTEASMCIAIPTTGYNDGNGKVQFSADGYTTFFMNILVPKNK